MNAQNTFVSDDALDALEIFDKHAERFGRGIAMDMAISAIAERMGLLRIARLTEVLDATAKATGQPREAIIGSRRRLHPGVRARSIAWHVLDALDYKTTVIAACWGMEYQAVRAGIARTEARDDARKIAERIARDLLESEVTNGR